MPAYVIAEVDISDQEAYAPYKPLAAGSLPAYGGRYLVRGGAAELLEGAMDPSESWWSSSTTLRRLAPGNSSPDYQEAALLRRRASNARIILVDGVPASQ